MSSDAEKQKLMGSILSQVNIGHINWDKVAKNLNLPIKSAAQMRWARFKKTLPNFSQESNGNSTTSPPATPKKRQSPTKSKANKRSPTKKQKLSKSVIVSDDEDDEPQFDSYDKEEIKEIVPETPLQSLPSRKAKVKSPIKDTVTSDEDEDEDEEIKIEDTQETQEIQQSIGSGRGAIDSGSDFGGSVEL
ncbi:hypothetical protein SBOR_8169 [Sclerotinia borealis F-4128]|uniref:Myb-like DNA-binding domain-containing protein n=1 Tax=Sclerotinia borealis (strain F-4128) TaxID=1432307 RepID=W9C6G1_SCLBF|nr:hypothetical protein SBOR_8169 [Sclerotinia borealis F-4128]